MNLLFVRGKEIGTNSMFVLVQFNYCRFWFDFWNVTKKQSIHLFSILVSGSYVISHIQYTIVNLMQFHPNNTMRRERYEMVWEPNHLRQLAYFKMGFYWLLPMLLLVYFFYFFSYAKVCIWSYSSYEFSFSFDLYSMNLAHHLSDL